ncbi:MAG: tyrosine-protein phosphatase [Lentilactobacillus diolivorans]|uniref:tyrosine-protein phosphatase n=1 Tax=Lentilactobacillus diolivorans TaxID=179838 RepID=UPI0039EA69B5
MDVEITNFRGLGGYPVANGKMKNGLLYRGGQIDNLSSNQVTFLEDDLNIARVVDFRSLDEAKQFPDTIWPGVIYQPIDVLVDAKKSGVSIQGMISNAGDISQVMLATYAQLVTSDSAQKGYHQFFEELVEDPKPTYFHCFAGKDRTGIAAAVILKMLGASEKTIFDDYLLTNQLRKKANAQLINQLADKMTAAQQHAMAKALVVDRSYLAHFFDTVKREYGQFETYLREGLQLEPGYVDQLRSLYVTESF